jgi:toxin ParE1/3/4
MGHKTEHPHVRALSVVRYPYVIFYTLILEADEVLILRVRHGRRRPLGLRET